MSIEPVDGLKDSVWVAQYLDVPLRTVDQWSYLGRGPRFYKIGKHRRYRVEDVEAWITANAGPLTAA